MNRKLILVLIICLSTIYNSIAQSGLLKGNIIDSETKETIIGANIIIDGTTKGAISDFDGNYTIEGLAPGTYSIKVIFIGYLPQTFPNIVIKGGQTTTLNCKLATNSVEIKEANVVSTRITNTENAVMMESRKAEQIVNGVSSQQISKTQDRNATEVIKRLPGVTIVEDRFVMIRGLGERYNSVMLNDAFAPSAEPDKRAFSFDIIPSSMLDRVMIYKTGAPELPGDFAGGVIKVYTKNTPDEDYVTAGYQISIRQNSTFEEYSRGSAGGTSKLGIDGGSNPLPNEFPVSLAGLSTQEQVNSSLMLPNSWVAKEKSTPIDKRFNASFAKSFLVNKTKVSTISGFSYSNLFEVRNSFNANYNAYDIKNQVSDTIYNYSDDLYMNRVSLGVISNWTFILNNRNKIEFRNLFNQNASNSTTIRTGNNIEEGNLVRNYAFRYFERTMYSGQVSGTHDFADEKSKLTWNTSFSLTRSVEPDYRRIRTFNSTLDPDTAYYVQINTSASQQDAGRFFSDLKEDNISGSVNYETTIGKPREYGTIKLRTGFSAEYKSRYFSARWMSYKRSNFDTFDYSLLSLPIDQVFSDQNINTTTGFKLDEGTNGTDKYDASNALVAYYVGTSYPLSNKLSLSGGVRFEANKQYLLSKDNNNNKLEVDNLVVRALPSLNATYNLNQKSLIRFAYARTLNRPEFREIAPFTYYDFVFNTVLLGNPNLETPSIDNVDLRWELYPRTGEMISFGAFYKNFTNPIEQYFIPGAGSGGTRNFTFGNAERSTSIGLEVEVRKSLESVFKQEFFNKFSIGANATIIKSNVELGAAAVGQNPDRPMMGQSPFAINAGLYYNDTKNKLQANIQYNIIGQRLYAVGTDGTPDVYELPRNILDFTISKGFGKHFEVKAGVQDIFNQKTILRQDADGNGKVESKDETVLSFKRGSVFSLGINLRY